MSLENEPEVVTAKVAEALSATVISTLRGRGARVACHDPHVPTVTVRGTAFASVRPMPATVSALAAPQLKGEAA